MSLSYLSTQCQETNKDIYLDTIVYAFVFPSPLKANLINSVHLGVDKLGSRSQLRSLFAEGSFVCFSITGQRSNAPVVSCRSF